MLALLSERKNHSIFDECEDDNWTETESFYEEVAESRRGYHQAPRLAKVIPMTPSIGTLYFSHKSLFIVNPIEQEFKELVEKWHQETMTLSSTTEITTNFNYYRIIALGKNVVPLILRELETNGGQWYLALRALTNENPVPSEDAGNIKKMKQAWIQWGKENNLI